MEINDLNQYLSSLTGMVDVVSIDIDQREASSTISLKFNGDVGTKDRGEIEIDFYSVNSQKLPYLLLGPVTISKSDEKIKETLNGNYIEEDCHLYTLTDSEEYVWWVYAKGFKAKFLPIFYGKET